MAPGSGSTLFGVDVCLDEEKLRNAPHCSHGPTLFFERFIGDSIETRQKQQYYACSACRDRKDCDFFQLVGEKVSEAKKKIREEHNRAKQPWASHNQVYEKYTKTLSLNEEDRRFCHKCSRLVLPDEAKSHYGHNISRGLSLAQMQKPSHLLRPIENKKTNAQYLFSDKAVDFLLDTISQLGYKKILCVGAPRIHEAIQQDSFRDLTSLLLDIDHRYGQFYPPDQFCRYNMFNHYFLDGAQSEAIFHKFLSSNHDNDILMVTDPPFGGLVEVLASGVKWIMDTWKQENNKEDTAQLPTMWIFPYFMENRIHASFPDFNMLDYKVAYDNHPLFQAKGKASKKGSPVRIFTNTATSKFVLPKEEGYRNCKLCKRYVSAENRHCKQCKACTSKDGSTYKHCNKCKHCVKPSYAHCDTCVKCELPTHNCNKSLQGCHICGALDHKRRECPQRGGQQQRSKQSNPKKRKHQGKGDSASPKIQKITSKTDVANVEMVKSNSDIDEPNKTGSTDTPNVETVKSNSKIDEPNQPGSTDTPNVETVKSNTEIDEPNQPGSIETPNRPPLVKQSKSKKRRNRLKKKGFHYEIIKKVSRDMIPKEHVDGPKW